jgi:hypothetical protein
MARVRTVEFLPEIFQTPVNRQFLNATLDQLTQEPAFTKTQGYVGRKVGPGVNPVDKYVVEPTKSRNDYQLEPGVISLDSETHDIVNAITYPGINDALKLQGATVTNPDSLYTSEYYTWDPFVDFDKFINYSQYYWLPGGPLAVDVEATGFPLTDNFNVTRANGVYTFSGVEGTNPTLTLVRGGNYTFQVAQNATESVNFRVQNNKTSAYVIDYENNPTLTLVRGNTYTFTMVLEGYFPFYIKTANTLGTTNLYTGTLSDGSPAVLNNGAATGTITFTVPQDAPDVLYYLNDLQYNMRGVFNIIDATPGTGPGFWIQTDPGVNGRIPSTPNISSRDVLGVINNGEDLGTVSFNVPLSTAQNFYYSLTPIGNVVGKAPGTVDLITNLKFNEINNIFVDQFFLANPDGIDGIKSLDGKTIVFQTQQPDPEAGGWLVDSFFDPLLRTAPNQVSETQSYDVDNQNYDIYPYETLSNVIVSGSPDPQDGQPGSFDSVPFDYTSVVDPADRYSVWQIQYKEAAGGGTYLRLVLVEPVNNLEKFSIQFGTKYASTSWYKDAEGVFEQIPLLTAIKNLLWYQDGTDPEIFGQIRVIDQDKQTTIFVEDIIGQKNYTSPNGVTFTNGLKVTFRGDVEPASYQNNSYYVEGVGTAIQLLPVSNFVTPETYTKSASIPYDSTPYDFGNFDASLNAPVVPDYLTINRAGQDLNAWTRSNRWFHIDVINASATYNNTTPVVDQTFRARRPILEYRAGLRLFDFGTEGKQPVDIIDFKNTDAFSTVNGSPGYNIDGYQLAEGSRVIFAVDTDAQVRNKIYVVQFVVPDTVEPLIPEPIINLVPAADNPILFGQSTVCMSGSSLQGKSFWYDGVAWIEAQEKTGVNQAPLFDVYDPAGISFSDRAKYPSSTFRGCKLFSYGTSNLSPDAVLGFPLRYLSLANVGDIVFDNNLYNDTFTYVINAAGQTLDVSTGFVRQYSSRVDFRREIGWQPAATLSTQKQQFQFTYDGSPLQLDVAVNVNTTVPPIQLYVNSQFQEPSTYSYTTTADTTIITLKTAHVPGDLIEVAVLSDQTSAAGFYQIPTNLENNPFNVNSNIITLGTARTHYETIGENLLALTGKIIGANNSRDLGNIIPYGQQILQQSSPLTLAGYFMRSQEYDIFGAIEYNSREYIKFKSLLMDTVVRNEYDFMSISDILDSVIAEITVGRTDINPFYWSDMLPTGSVYTQTVNTITPVSTPTFNTIQTYNFTSSNFLGLLVYLTRTVDNRPVTTLLTRDIEYVVSTDSPRLTVTVPLNTGDVVTIKEYGNTAGNFVPNTPTKLGLYPKFVPQMFYDQDYVNPTPVIQGHDGSITVAFGDIRDEILLEFERRIYNNLKNDGNPIPLTVADVIPGFFRTTNYTQTQINNILSESFLTWVGWNKLDYKAQDYIANNPFTYNYSTAGNKINEQPLLGAWRGIYRYFYDTLSPNYTPWEMLGLSEMPAWWEDRYGPAPYTSDNLVLWDDLEAGLVADPIAPYVKPQYARSGLSQVIPNGTEGQLLNPLESVVGQYNPNDFRKSWSPGDGGPVEASWWASSSYPFAIMRLLALTRPAEFFALFADRDLYRYDLELEQYLYNGRYRLNANGVQVYGDGVSKASYINWIVDYNKQSGRNSTSALTLDLQNLDVRLCYRMASFTDKQYLNVYVERSSPESTNSSLQLPDDSYNLLLYKNQPTARITYSALIVEIVEGGYSIYGYNNATPYFNILASASNGLNQTIQGGGAVVRVPAQYTNQVVQVPYGFTFTNATVVVDFILSYGEYLKSQGLIFNDRENGYTLNWNQMATEFLYFSQQGWANGTIINLNPSAVTLKAFRAGEIVDTIESTSPENMILDQNRNTLPTRNLVVLRDGDSFSVSTTLANQSISYLNMKFTSYESMVVLDNVSIFSDLVYDPVTAARQNRIKITAATSTEWNGVVDAQGFILNQNNVKEWVANKRYTKGEIVLYKNNYWQAMNIVQPKIEFDYQDWVKSNYTKIQKGLLPNIANKANQLANSYNINSANLEGDNDLLAYGLIGYRPRQYMTDLNLDNVSQVNLYKQFLGTKGTRRAAELFRRADLGKESAEYNIYENWGVLVSTYGANANRSFIELRLNEAYLRSDPCTVQVTIPGETSQANQTILLDDIWRESYKLTSPDILPTTYTKNLDTALPSAGYVNLNDVDITVFDLNDPTSIAKNINKIGVGTTIWAAKSNSYDWDVYRCGRVPGQLVQVTDNLNGTSLAQFNTAHGLKKGDLIVMRYFNSAINGVYRVLSVPNIQSITVSYKFNSTNQTSITGTGLVFYLQTMRVAQASDVASLPYSTSLLSGARAYVDDNGDGHWEVLEKQSPFTSYDTIQADPQITNSKFGTSVTQSENLYSALVGAPGTGSDIGYVYAYRVDVENRNYVQDVRFDLATTDVVGYGNAVDFGRNIWAVAGASASNSLAGYASILYRDPRSGGIATRQLLVAPGNYNHPIQFGTDAAMSLDERWLYVTAPYTANGNKVYAYGRVDVESQSVRYRTDGTTLSYNWSDSIVIDYAQPDQLIVNLNNTVLVEGIDYSVDQNNITLGSLPSENLLLIISRRNAIQLDKTTYYNVEQDSVTGYGLGATFTIEDTRGTYNPTLSYGGTGYDVGNQLTILGTSIGGATPANNLVITVTEVTDGAITAFTFTGSGINNAATFSLSPYLYTATNIYAFTVVVAGKLQRPFIDYTFDNSMGAQEITFNTLPAPGAVIAVIADTYWQYCGTISVPGIDSGAKFGISTSTTTDGRQVFIGSSRDSAVDANNTTIAHAGSVYVFDRSVVKLIINNTNTVTYSMPGTVTSPVSVLLNNEFLDIYNITDANGFVTTQFINGQVNVNYQNKTITLLGELTVGDVVEIETNVFQEVQKVTANTVLDESAFGSAVDICPNNCSLYIGAPLDSTVKPQAGSVERNVNQSRVYGVTTTTVANPSLTAGDTIRINDIEVTVPDAPNNTISGLVAAINAEPYLSTKQYYVGDRVSYNNASYIAIASGINHAPTNLAYWAPSVSIPNVTAGLTPNATFIGNSATTVFDVGTLYSSASDYTPVVYVNTALQVYGVDYTYNNNTQQIIFLSPPAGGTTITVVSGRMTLSVKNVEAAIEGNRLTVLPGVIGSAFYDLGFDTFVWTQKITSPNPSEFAFFGSSVHIDSSAVNLVVGAPNGNMYEPTTFDAGKTYFDERSTTFFNLVANSGIVYTYDYLRSAGSTVTNVGQFVFGQQIYTTEIKTSDQFGTAVNFTSGRLLIGAPGNDNNNPNENYGLVTSFNNPDRQPAWKVIHEQQPVVDVSLLNGVFMYDRLSSSTQTYFDFFDPLQGKILGAARRNIDYLGAVDPANYNAGSIHNQGNSWGSERVGQIWWDTDTVRFIDPNQDDIVYASRKWGQTFPGSRVDIYQWTASSVPPVSYTGSGTPLSTVSYSVRSALNDQNVFVTTYYFWVRGVTTINTAAGKTLSPTGIASYIENPRSSGIPYIATLNASTVAIYNGLEYISAADTILHIDYDREYTDANIHQEYQLIADGKAGAFLSPAMYRKLQDSLCGVDSAGAVVPDPFLSPAERYGVQFRPRQSMFADRFTALENYLGRANTVLKQYPIVETKKLSLLNSAEPEPIANSGAWDKRVANLDELSYQNIYIVPLGYLYLVASDSNQNGLWTIYEVAASDAVAGQRLTRLVRVQNYDTKLYWDYIDWYMPGYNSTVQPIATVPVYSALGTLTLTQAPIGSSVKVTANAQGKFEIYLRTVLGWDRVGLEGGTIQFKEELWNYSAGNFGFGVEVFDAQYFDQEPVIETRKIIQAINEELFVDELALERNSSLMLMFNFIYSEFTAPEWLIRTSLIDVSHNVRSLLPYQNYLQDNQTFVLDYLKEVKPYHVQIREFNLSYNGLDDYLGNMTDFDVPAYWNSALEIPQYISPVLTPYTASSSIVESFTSDAGPEAQIWTANPWSYWYNNYLLEITGTTVINGGSGYTIAPDVVVNGDCIEPAVMTAIINSAGRVVGLNIINPGAGYSTTATITFTGGNGQGAVAVTIMGNGLVRNINTTIKYDRCEYTSNVTEWSYAVASYPAGALVRYVGQVWEANDTVTNTPVVVFATGAPDASTLTVASATGIAVGMLVTGLNIPADTRVTIINGTTITINRVLLNTISYQITFYDVFDPAQWTVVPSETLSGADRTMGFYTPTPNQPGLSLPLLIDGIDYPGVQVTGPLFSQNSGFDVGNYDVNPFDNIAYGPEGRPTYDPAILDAIYESSYLDPYLGTRPTDVNVDGGAYIDPYSSHAPEELVPGAEFDTLDFRVYTRPGADWTGNGHGFPERFANFVFDSEEPTLSFAGVLNYPAQIIVYNQTAGLELTAGYNYTVNWPDQTITILNNVNTGNIVAVSVYGIGGGNQLYQQNYNGGDIGNTITVPVAFNEIQDFVIFVNGMLTSDYSYEAEGARSTTITFGTTYTFTDFINLTAIGPTTTNGVTTNYDWSTPQTQVIIADGSTLSYELDNSLAYTNPDNLIVTVNGVRARTSAGIEWYGDGSTDYLLPDRLGFSQSIIANNEVHVYVNDIPQILGVDFTLEPYTTGDLRAVQFFIEPAIGARILICVTTLTQCYVNGNQLVFVEGLGLTPVLGDVIAVTTWNDTRQQNILTKVVVGPITTGATLVQPYDSTDFDSPSVNSPFETAPGQFDYSAGTTITVNDIQLGRVITDTSRLWVTLNGYRLFPNYDFTVSGEELILTAGLLKANDVLMISEFTNSIVPEAMAFRIFQDMRGVQATYRITPTSSTTLTQPLSMSDDIIYVDNASALGEPSLDTNIWGVLMVDGERIMYRERNTVDNTISSLLRGTAGTAAADHDTGAIVTDLGRGNLLALEFQNYIVSNTLMADGSTTEFIANNIDLLVEDSTIRDESVEVYVAGIRVESGYTITNDNPCTVEFDIAPPPGEEVTILVRRGVTWYNPGVDTPSNGVPLQDTNNQCARFLQGRI